MTIAPKKRFSILERDGFMCKYCGGKPPFVQLEVDHIIPKSKGGKDIEDNLITSCSVCNIGKGSKVIGESEVNLWKKKINDGIYRTKMKFYDDWNNLKFGNIDEKTKTLLSLFITNIIKGENGEGYKEYYDYTEYFKMDIKPIDIGKWRIENKDIWETQFKLGGDFCEQVINDLIENKCYILDMIKDDIMDDSIWKIEGRYSDKLNYKLTENWDGEFYVIKKFTLFHNAFKNEV